MKLLDDRIDAELDGLVQKVHENYDCNSLFELKDALINKRKTGYSISGYLPFYNQKRKEILLGIYSNEKLRE